MLEVSRQEVEEGIRILKAYFDSKQNGINTFARHAIELLKLCVMRPVAFEFIKLIPGKEWKLTRTTTLKQLVKKFREEWGYDVVQDNNYLILRSSSAVKEGVPSNIHTNIVSSTSTEGEVARYLSGESEVNHHIASAMDALMRVQPSRFEKYTRLADWENKADASGTSADFMLYFEDQRVVPLSIKSNHQDTKHNRPTNIPCQVTGHDDEKYREGYASLQESCYGIISSYKLWNEVPKEDKYKVYKDINTYVAGYLARQPLHQFVMFCLGGKDTVTLYLKCKKGDVSHAELRRPKSPSSTERFEVILRSDHIISIKWSNNSLTMRLHNDSSKIPQNKRLNLKYACSVDAWETIYKAK